MTYVSVRKVEGYVDPRRLRALAKTERECTRCRTTKVVEEFRTGPNGLPQSWCRSCHNAHSSAKSRAKHAESKAARQLAPVTCSKCGHVGQFASWPRGSGGRLMKTCGHCPLISCGENRREYRRAIKAKYRRVALRPTRAELAAKAQARRQQQAEQQAERRVKHDAHVKAWRESREYGRQLFNRLTAELSDGYIKRRLCKNFPQLRRSAIPVELIEAERARLFLMRATKQEFKSNEELPRTEGRSGRRIPKTERRRDQTA